MPEDLPNDDDELQLPPSFFPMDKATPAEEHSYGEPVLVRIEGIFGFQLEGDTQRLVLLTDGHRKLPIVIGATEALSISQALEKVTPDRPMTHDLIRTLVERFGAKVEKVVIDDLWNKVYYAKLFVKSGSETIEIDSRPSDAIAIAARFDAPIFVADGILDLEDDGE